MHSFFKSALNEESVLMAVPRHQPLGQDVCRYGFENITTSRPGTGAECVVTLKDVFAVRSWTLRNKPSVK